MKITMKGVKIAKRPGNQPGQLGFSLIELLVVVAVISILAAIAVPQFASYRKKGADASMESALNNARIAMEAYYEVNDYTYAGATVPALESRGYRGTFGLDLDIVNASTSTYTVRACLEGGSHPSFLFDADVGKIRGDPGACS